jgi:hypothetical protein
MLIYPLGCTSPQELIGAMGKGLSVLVSPALTPTNEESLVAKLVQI